MDTEVVIVGGGLSGLALAKTLHEKAIPFTLIEARRRLGGRILTQTVSTEHGVGSFDLGPAWYWPGQNRIAALVAELRLVAFQQYDVGITLYEDADGRILKTPGYGSMAGSLRLRHGMGALITAIAAGLPAPSIMLNRSVIAIDEASHGIVTRSICTASGEPVDITSHTVVLALPPRLAAATIELPASVSEAVRSRMTAVPTWMAGQAKALAIYAQPFWRTAGLSGDVLSQHGPLVEIHDASPTDGGPYALFGFLGVPAGQRGDAHAIKEAVRMQLGRIFGSEAHAPIDLLLQDWASDPFTATGLDHAPLDHHPKYGLPSALASLCKGKLMLGSTEVADRSGGYLEGALEAAERCYGQIARPPASSLPLLV